MIRLRPTRRFLVRGLVFSAVVLLISIAGLVAAWFAWPLPEGMLEPGPPGAMALDRSGGVLLDVTGEDEQRRLPIHLADAGPWIPHAVIAAEDAAFRRHHGIDLPAVAGAMRDNILAGRVVRGASTITMQVAGLRLGHPRTFRGKAIEGFRALQIEAEYAKDDILEAWLNIAPFGGNLVGVEAASRAWLGKSAGSCSLSESALLVGLPNSPERFRPDRHPQAALDRRDVVLERMLEHGFISEVEYQKAIQEVILVRGSMANRNDVHAGWMALGRSGRGRVIRTTIDPNLQSIAEGVVQRHADRLPDHLDIALALVDLDTSRLHAVVGSSDFADPRDGQVNGVVARRSPGSALKPFVYATAFEARRLAPSSIVDDAEVDLAGWRPENIDQQYLGEMTAADALRLSRNTPAIRIASEIGFSNVIATLRRCGLKVPLGAADHFGVSMVVGGMETTPLDLLAAYATLARGGTHVPIRLLDGPAPEPRRVLSPETCAAVERCLAGPATDVQSVLPFLAAKTGTSSGHRDAVAAGWNRRYAAVVWVGRFDGGSDPALLGSDAALPVLEELLCHPQISTVRTDRMADAVDWQIHRPVGRSSPRVPAIIEPRNGDRLIAMDGSVEITPKLRVSGEGETLFLNGRPVDGARLRLKPGRYQLRVVEPGKTPHVIAIEVASEVLEGSFD